MAVIAEHPTQGEGWSESLTLEVRDNGAGFDPAQVGAGHMGLGTMGQRAAARGGEYDVRSAPGEGTAISVRLPPGSRRMEE